MKIVSLVAALFLVSNAHAIAIDPNDMNVPSEIVVAAEKAISERCEGMSSSTLELIDFEVDTVKVDNGKTDKTYSLVLEVPNKTNDDDEDTIEISVLKAAIDNPAIENPTVTALEAYGWTTCK